MTFMNSEWKKLVKNSCVIKWKLKVNKHFSMNKKKIRYCSMANSIFRKIKKTLKNFIKKCFSVDETNAFFKFHIFSSSVFSESLLNYNYINFFSYFSTRIQEISLKLK